MGVSGLCSGSMRGDGVITGRAEARGASVRWREQGTWGVCRACSGERDKATKPRAMMGEGSRWKETGDSGGWGPSQGSNSDGHVEGQRRWPEKACPGGSPGGGTGVGDQESGEHGPEVEDACSWRL